MEPPVAPTDTDCCNSGCNPCILDIYEIQLKKYKKFLENNAPGLPQRINAINELSFTNYKVIDRVEIAPNIIKLKFLYNDSKTPHPNCLQFKNGQHFLLRAKDVNGEFTRAYSPLPNESSELTFTIIVKFYELGRISKQLRRLEIGACTAWRGPYGDFSINYTYKYFVFVAQGTGIAPIYGIIHEILHNEDCESFVKLFYCCKSGEILFRDEFYTLGSFWNFSYEIFVNPDKIEAKYNELVRNKRFDFEDLQSYVKNKENLQGIVCGSDSFNTSIKNYMDLLEMKSNIFIF